MLRQGRVKLRNVETTYFVLRIEIGVNKMPACNIFLFGNLPAEIDLDKYGEAMGVSVETKTGTLWLDLSDAELDAIVASNQVKVDECMRDYLIGAREYSMMLARDLRNGRL